MRIIDADALKDNMFHYAPREMVWDRGDVEHKINEMPTIDAIPVEWIQAQVENEKRAPLFRRYADALLTIWQKEQEVANEAGRP